MDYYYALLESYSLLKKRKFKISIHEQEEKSPEDQKYEQDLLAIIKTGQGQPTSAPKNVNGVDLAQGEEAIGTAKISGRIGGDSRGMWGTLTNDGTSLIDNPSPSVKGMYSKLLPRDEKEPWKQDVSDKTDRIGRNKMDPEVEAKLEAQKQVFEAEVQRISAGLRKIGNRNRPVEYGAEEGDVERQLPWLEKAKLEVERQVENSERKFSAEQIKAVLDGIGDLIDLSVELLDNKNEATSNKYVQKINAFIQTHNLTLDEDGILQFNGISFGVDTTRPNVVSKALAQATRQMEDAAIENIEEEGIASPAQLIPHTQEKFADQHQRNAFRGVASEAMDSCAPLLFAWLKLERGKTEKEREKGKKEVVEARGALQGCIKNEIKDGNVDVDLMMQAMGDGWAGIAGDIFTDDEVKFDAAGVKFIKDSLMEIYEMSEEEAERIIEDIVNDGDFKSALFVILLANGRFTDNLFGDEGEFLPNKTRTTGQDTGAQSPGNKADVVDVFCMDDERFQTDGKPDVEKLKGHFTELLGPEEMDYYATADDSDCLSEDGMAGVDNLFHENEAGSDEKCQSEECGEAGCWIVDREMKVHGKAGQSTMGETSFDNLMRLCSDDGSLGEGDKNKLTDEGREFGEKQKQRLDQCGFDSGKACGALTDMNGKMKPVLDILQKGGMKIKGMKSAKAAAGAALDMFEQRRHDMLEEKIQKLAENPTEANAKKIGEYTAKKADITARKEAAQACVNNADAETPEYKGSPPCAALELVRSEIKENLFVQELDKLTNDNGTLEPAGRDVLLFQYAVTLGAMRETINDKRVLDTGVQKVYLRNASLRAALVAVKEGRGRIVRKKGSKSSKIETTTDKKPTKDSKYQSRGTITLEKGTTKVKVPASTGHSIDKGSMAAKREAQKKKDLDTQEKRIKREVKKELDTRQNTPEVLDEIEKRLKAWEDEQEELGTWGKPVEAPKFGRQKAPPKKSKTEDIFLQYIKGQQKLFETLFNQTT